MASRNGINGYSKGIRLLVINPNSSRHLTEGLEKLISDLGYSEATKVEAYTAPSGPNSINNEDDAKASAEIVAKDLKITSLATVQDGILVACYSVHPLTIILKTILPNKTPVVGIFEASIGTALSLLPPPSNGKTEKFGIVTTGKYWEQTLTNGVLNFMGCETLAACKRFKGVESTGLSAAELHTSASDVVRTRMMDATKRLLRDRDVSVICLGCAGMAGMDAIVNEACDEELGPDKAQAIHIIDGVKAGLAMLDGLARSHT